MFQLTDSGYERVLDGTLKAVSETQVLVEKCREPGRCGCRWFSRGDWSEASWRSPVRFGSLSEGSRVLRYSSPDGSIFVLAATGELLHHQTDPEIRDNMSPDGRFITATFRYHAGTYGLVDLDSRTIYALPMDLTPDSGMPLLVVSD